MNITKTLYVVKREDWRAWLKKYSKTEKEIWLIYYRKSSGKPRIEYNAAVEEALCFGWIDSIEKGIDDERFAQRFSPRKLKSIFSETNRERVKRLIKQKKMTQAGLTAIAHAFDIENPEGDEYKIPEDILTELKKDKIVWKNFQTYTKSYKRMRVGWIDAARKRPDEFKKRLNYFIKMTTKNKKFGILK